MSASFEGAEAILHDKPSLILHVRLSQLSIDDWGVKCQLAIIPTPGIEEFGHGAFPFENSWTVLSFAAGWWHTSSIPGANWALYFEPQLVKEIVETAAVAAQNNSTVTYADLRESVYAFHGRLTAEFHELTVRALAKAQNNPKSRPPSP